VNARLQLHGYWRSSAAYRVRIALHHKGLHFEYVPVHLLRDGGEQRSASYRALNPQGLVPTLVVDGELALGQSLAICEYLEERWPHPALLPTEPRGRAIVRSMALVVACDVHPLNNLSVTNYLRAECGQDDAAVKRWMHTWMSRGFAALEALIERHSADGFHAFGDTVTFADAFLVPQVYNAHRFGLDLGPYPRVAAVAAHLEALPAFRAARPEAQRDAEAVRAG
jgi:maleylacetoacetate isomerase